MLRFLIILLLSSTCLDAGTVKTFDGAKVDKDSAAELRVHVQHGDKIARAGLFAYVISVDTVQLFDKFLAGEDYSQGHLWSDTLLEKILTADNAAYRLKKVYVTSQEHKIRIQCVFLDVGLKVGEYRYSNPLDLVFTPSTGHKYEIDAKLVDEEWIVWIVDKENKQVVASSEDLQISP